MPDHRSSATTPRKYAAIVFGFLLMLDGLASPIPLPAQQGPTPSSRFAMSVRLEGAIQAGAMVNLLVSVRALEASPAAEVRIHLPPSITTLAGDPEWSGHLAKGQSTELRLSVRLDSAGVWRVVAVASDSTDVEGVASVAKDELDGLYLAVGSRAGFSEPQLTEPFVPAGRRAIAQQLGSRALPAVQRSLREGDVLYAPVEPGTWVGSAVNDELARLDWMGWMRCSRTVSLKFHGRVEPCPATPSRVACAGSMPRLRR